MSGNEDLAEKLRKLREEKWRRMTDYQRALKHLKAHAGYTETKARLLRLLREVPYPGVRNPEIILSRLIKESKIVYQSKYEPWAYTLKFITASEES